MHEGWQGLAGGGEERGACEGTLRGMLDVGTTGLAFRASYVPGLIADRAQLRAEYAAGARSVAAADEERRRVVLDLHDGAQQRLVHTVVLIKLAQQPLARCDGK